MVRFIYDHQRSRLGRLRYDLLELLLRICRADGIVGIQNGNNAHLIGNRVQHLLKIQSEIRIIGNRFMVQAENLAVDPVHLEGGRNRHHRGTGPPEYLKQIADRHIGAIDHAEIFPPYPQITGKRLKEAFRLRIRGEKFRRKLRLNPLHKLRRESLRVFIHIQPQIRKAPLTSSDPQNILYTFLYIHTIPAPPRLFQTEAGRDNGFFSFPPAASSYNPRTDSP